MGILKKKQDESENKNVINNLIEKQCFNLPR